MPIKIGIPRALFYYRYYPFWNTFFAEIGAETVISVPTTKKILDMGVSNCVDEACLPVKVFHGHVLSIAKNSDMLFIPRFTSVSKKEYICPKFGGLPDMVRGNIRDLPPVLSPEINLYRSRKNSFKVALETGKTICRDLSRIKHAYKSAVASYRQHRDEMKNKSAISDTSINTNINTNINANTNANINVNINANVNANFNTNSNAGSYTSGYASGYASSNADNERGKPKKILLIGHPYLVYDNGINMGVIDKLTKYGAQVVTAEMFDTGHLRKNAARLPKPMFWHFGSIALGCVTHAIESGGYDGIIYIMSFGCGIDSFVNDLAERKTRRNSDIPYMILSIDEHTGEAGFNTRIEAFMDMIGWRDKRDGYVSASW
jgi:predicted nucleotide-binding protein (sugar kinase/HSP70/actin superfamily)